MMCVVDFVSKQSKATLMNLSRAQILEKVRQLWPNLDSAEIMGMLDEHGEEAFDKALLTK